MTEFLKGYAAGANDMEAGRLVTSASFTDEDVERVAAAISAALWDTWSIERECTVAPLQIELEAAARAALSAYLESTTKGDT